MNTVDADPAECRLLVVRVVCLLYQTDRLKHICDIVKSSDLGLQALGLLLSEVLQARAIIDIKRRGFVHSVEVQAKLLPPGDLSCGLLKRYDTPPGYEKSDELLAEDPKGFVSLVLADLVIILVDLPNQKAWLTRFHDGCLL